MKSFLLSMALLFSVAAKCHEIIFKKDGQEILKLTQKELNSGKIRINGRMIKYVDQELFNAWRGYKKTYRGYSLGQVLNAVYGKSWTKLEKISFSALDGYKQTANIKRMLKSARSKSGYISYTEADKKGFSKFKRKGKTIDPGPFYLVWTNFSDKDKASHGDNLKWPYQLKTIELTSSK